MDGDDSCNPADPNDFVDDTPAQAGPSIDYVDNCVTNISGDEPPVDTCPNLPGVDPLLQVQLPVAPVWPFSHLVKRSIPHKPIVL